MPLDSYPAETTKMNPKLSICKQTRILSFFRENKFVDCTFIIDGEEVKAHKLVLASSSPVFEKMLFGSLASDEIILHDIKVLEFKQMLEFLYTECIDFTSIAHAWSIFYIGKKYLMECLIDVCIDHISKNLTLDSLVLSYEYCDLYNLDKMKDQCFRDIVDGVNGIFVSDYHMKPSTLRTILKETLVITKIDLICKILEWTINECELRGMNSTPKNIVHILQKEDILRHINKKWLLEMKCEYCNNTLIICQCVGEVIHETLKYLNTEVNWEEEPESKRLGKIMPCICKGRKIYKIAQRMELGHYEEFVTSFIVNRKVVISGLFLCTEMNRSNTVTDEYNGCLVIRFCEHNCSKDILKPTIMNSVFAYDSQVFIPLRYAITLMANKTYDVRISYKNFDTNCCSSIVCSYMSDHIIDKKRGHSKIIFYDFYGTVIKGVAFYPI